MLRVLKSLLALLLVAALGATTLGSATASPCVGHPVEIGSVDRVGMSHSLVEAEFFEHAAHRHETDGKCAHPCCTAPAMAALPNIIRPYVALRMMPAGFAALRDHLPSGIDVTPLTGPPKLSA